MLPALLAPTRLAEGGAELLDRTYYPGGDADDLASGLDEYRHRANLYFPPGPGPHPVIVFVHGGWWMTGSPNGTYGIYRRLGRRLADAGFITVIPAYRLAPDHPFPAQVRDVSRAIVWTWNHAESLGGDPRSIFLMGHSAGAHLVALAATDPRWLEEAAEACERDGGFGGPRRARASSPRGDLAVRVAGVIGISGPYDITDLAASNEIRVEAVFGRDPAVWRAASPTMAATSSAHVLPPFVVVTAERDFPTVLRTSRTFAENLTRAGARVEEVSVPGKTHSSIIVELGAEHDALLAVIERFVRSMIPPRPE